MIDDLAHVHYIKLGTVGNNYSQYRVSNVHWLCREQQCMGSDRYSRVCWLRRLHGDAEHVVGVSPQGRWHVWSARAITREERQQLEDVARAHVRRLDTNDAWRWWYELPVSQVTGGDWRDYRASDGSTWRVRALSDPMKRERAFECREDRAMYSRLVLVNGVSAELRAQDAVMIGERSAAIVVDLADRHRRFLHGFDDS